MKNKTAVSNLGAEEVAQMKAKVLTRAATRAEADLLFHHKATGIAAANQKRLKELFVQADGAETMAPSLAKTAAVDQFFDKVASANLTEAQVRYPELLKVAGPLTNPAPSLKRLKSAVATTSSLAGGAS